MFRSDDQFRRRARPEMRKQTLDVAQQAQVAACLYLGFDPHDIKYNWQRNVESRPLELHLHHHHHHYMDNPGYNKLVDTDSSPRILDGPKAEYYVQDDCHHQEMILNREMDSRAWSSNNTDSYYSGGSLRYLPQRRATPPLLPDWEANNGEPDYGNHYYMSSSKTECVATSVKRKTYCSEHQRNEFADGSMTVPPDSRICDSKMEGNAAFETPSLGYDEPAFRGAISPACRVNNQQGAAGQFVMRRSGPRMEAAADIMNVRGNSLFVEDNASFQQVQPRVHGMHINDEDVKQETCRLQQLLAHEKMKGDAYRAQLLSVQDKYRALSKELQETRQETAWATPAEDKTHADERSDETTSGNDTPPTCGSQKKAKTYGNVGPGGEKKTSLEGSSEDSGNELNGLLQNFSKRLDKKLKEEMFIKVTKAIESVLDNGCSSEKKTIKLEPGEQEKVTASQSRPVSARGVETPATYEDQPGQQLRSNSSSSSPTPNGYSNVYHSPVFEEQNCSEHDGHKTASSHTRLEQDTSLQTPAQASQRNLDKSFLALEQGELCDLEKAMQNLGGVCEEHKRNLESLSFGDGGREQNDVKHLREHYVTILNDIGNHVNDLHCDLEEEKQNRQNAENELKLSDLTKEVKAKEEALHLAREENQRLASELSKAESALSLLQKQYTELKTSLEAEVKESKGDIQQLEKTILQLKTDLARSVSKGATLANELQKSESKVATLEDAVAGKESEVQEGKKKLCSAQKEADEALLEKYEAVNRLHESKRDADDQRQRIDELVGINDELLIFARGKEEEIARNATKMRAAQEENARLKAALKQATEKITEEDELNLKAESLRTKLADTEHELSQREEALTRLSSQLSSTIEIQDKNAQEAEQLREKLKDAELQAAKKDDELHRLRVIVHDLEIKLTKMEEQQDDDDLRLHELVDGKAGKNCDDIFNMLQSSGDTRWRVQQLEEEILEKEGQIAILRSSFPEDYGPSF